MIESFLESLPNDDRDAFERAIYEIDWRTWLDTLYPMEMRSEYADFHADLWKWVWNIPDGREAYSYPSFIGVWARGAAKSTNAELAAVNVGARSVRSYLWYVCATQDQADDHVASIAALLNNPTLSRLYPAVTNPALTKFGQYKAWRRNRIQTAQGFTIDALGLDRGVRGGKVEDKRPDFMIFDDIDSEGESPSVTEKKMETIAQKIIPAGADSLVILAIQNLIHANSIFARFAGISEYPTDLLAHRVISGPVPALRDAIYDESVTPARIIAGTPTWNGMSVERCQSIINKTGLSAFKIECQHEIDDLYGGMFRGPYKYVTWQEVPQFVRVVVWVDPSVTSTDKSDNVGIICDALGVDNKIYRLFTFEGILSPLEALKLAITTAIQFKAEYVGVETDQGGDTWLSVFHEAMAELYLAGMIPHHGLGFAQQKAGAGAGPKVHRATQMRTAYELDMFRHLLGATTSLEKSLKRFPKYKPFDLVDAAYWSYYDLAGNAPFAVAVGGSPSSLVVAAQMLGQNAANERNAISQFRPR